MILIRPSFSIMKITSDPLRLIEVAGRTCYKSEDRITAESSERFVNMVTKRGHHSVIEHAIATVKIVCDRGVTHELVRHRLCSFSQESTRYCNYAGGVTFVIPPWVKIDPGTYENKEYPRSKQISVSDLCWFVYMMDAEHEYKQLLHLGWSPEKARSVLPNSTKTEIVVTANVREWRHIFKLRCSKAAHPQMREIMKPMLAEFKRRVPVIFDDL